MVQQFFTCAPKLTFGATRIASFQALRIDFKAVTAEAAGSRVVPAISSHALSGRTFRDPAEQIYMTSDRARVKRSATTEIMVSQTDQVFMV